MTIALLIDPGVGNQFDGVTFADPVDDFDYERESQGYFVATSKVQGAIGVFDLMAMLQEIDRLRGNIFDRAATEAGNSAALTDLILERVLVDLDDTNGIDAPMGTQSPPSPNHPNGVPLWNTPRRSGETELTDTYIQAGGTGVLTNALSTDVPHFGGCVLLPTAYRWFIGPTTGGMNVTATLWLAPFASASILPALCCCAFPTPQTEPEPAPPPPPP